ncbi:hypothetical protein DFH06DRAFT_950447, partial [Mycena polygramma]
RLGPKVDKDAARLGQRYSILSFGCIHGIPGGTPASNGAIGIGKDGSFAEYIIASADLLVPVPDSVPDEVAAIASDAGITAYHAVQRSA